MSTKDTYCIQLRGDSLVTIGSFYEVVSINKPPYMEVRINIQSQDTEEGGPPPQELVLNLTSKQIRHVMFHQYIHLGRLCGSTRRVFSRKTYVE